MGILTSVLSGTPIGATYADWDDFWYRANPRGATTQAGYPVSADGSLRLAAVNGCVRLIAGVAGMLPLILYRRLDGEAKEKATTNPLYKRLHDQPNGWQTSKEWRTWGTECLLLRGNFYNEILYDRRGAITELRPLHPDRTRVTLLESGRRGFLYRPPKGPERALTQDEVFHVTGPFSLDGGVTGCSVIEFARETVGSSHASKGFAANFWRQGAEGHVAFIAPNQMSPASREANEKALQASIGGWQNAHRILLLDSGLKPERITALQKDTQYLDTQKFSVEEICMFFGTSPDMIGHNDGTSQWGTGIESRKQGFVDFTLMPWLVSYEQSIARDLILDDSYFAKFNVDAFLRGDTQARATSHRQYVDGGIKSVNEVRALEDLNPLPGDEFDKPHRAGNMGGTPGGGNPATTQRGPTGPPQPKQGGQQGAIAREVAVRLVRREVAAIRKWAPRYAADAEGWRKWVAEFYGRYVEELQTALALDTTTARAYCAEHCAMVAHSGEISEEYEQTQPAALAALALEAGE